MRFCNVLWIVLVLLPWTVATTPAAAQRRGQQMEMAHLNGDGVVKAIRPRVLMLTVGTDDWLVAVPEDYQQLLYEAKATTRWLQRGMPVQLTATLVAEKRRREYEAKEPVAELTVAPLLPNAQPGVFPEQNGGDQRTGLFSRQEAGSETCPQSGAGRNAVPCYRAVGGE